MQEVLSKTVDPKAPLRGQEFYELFLCDSKASGMPVFYVREAHAEWSDLDGQIMWDKEQFQTFVTLQEAKAYYAKRRLILAGEGFMYSDMELIQSAP